MINQIRRNFTTIGPRKLNFNDVLLVPQKSYIQSRAQVKIATEYTFRHSTHTWRGVPIIAANMSTVTNVETATLLAEHNWCSVFPKFFNEGWTQAESENAERPIVLPEVLAKPDNYALSCGTSQGDIATMFEVCDNIQ